ncbi:uracil-DNA glycosylase-like protein [Spinellus fusiger]|nr:uracil-DNA glycosylase-like protein [Spinellus fusiger]
MSGLKRASVENGTKDTGIKKKAVAPTRQTTLFSMFKPAVSQSKESKEKDTQTVGPFISTENTVIETKTIASDLCSEDKECFALELKTMEEGWFNILLPEMKKKYFTELKAFLKSEKDGNKAVYPPEDQIYSWSVFTPLSNVKIVILGQDPYHNVNQAHGLCFSVRKGVNPPPSLVNIYTAIQKDYPDFKKPKHGYLEAWAQQGVLMLNTSLTVRAHEPASHAKKGWEEFTGAIIDHLNSKKKNIVFLLWGAHAQKKGAKIDTSKHKVLKAVHPSPLSAHRGFFECGHFKTANEYLVEHGKKEIQWNCLPETLV